MLAAIVCYDGSMILYVDETENEEYFIVAGLLVDSTTTVEKAYQRFKRRIKGFKLHPKSKGKIYTEFKSTLLDNDYQRIKVRMLEEIRDTEGAIIYSCYLRKGLKFNQVLKESVYITLLSSIVKCIDTEVEIVFDSFGKADFEDRIIKSVFFIDWVKAITPGNSEIEHGLQFADNICSVIRLHKSGDPKDMYYKIIENLIQEV